MSVCTGGEASLIKLTAEVVLDEELHFSASIAATLQMWSARTGEIYTARGVDGLFYRCRLIDLDEEGGCFIPFEQMSRSPESSIRLTVYVALPESFEPILRGLTELGVDRIVPFVSARSMSVEEREVVREGAHRWPDVLVSAAKQCRRAKIPELAEPVDWDGLLGQAGMYDLRMLMHEGEVGWRLREAIGDDRPHSVMIVSGPEDGFTPEEVGQAQNCGILPVSLGGRVLRAKTAAIVGSALVQHVLGDCG